MFVKIFNKLLITLFLFFFSFSCFAMQVKKSNVYTDYTITEFLSLDISSIQLIKFFPSEYSELSSMLDSHDLSSSAIQYKCWGSSEIGIIHDLSDYKTGFDNCTGTTTSTVAFYSPYYTDLQNLLNSNSDPDVTAPVLTLIGSSTVNHQVNTAYSDDGATCIDNADGDISANIQTVNNVDSNNEGSYLVTYNCTDSSNNQASQLTRTVNVYSPANNFPVLTLVGSSTIQLTVGDTYVESGAVANDQEDGDLSASVVISGSVDTSVSGVYTINYSVTDSSGNTATQNRVVTVVDKSASIDDKNIIRYIVFIAYGFAALKGFSTGLNTHV